MWSDFGKTFLYDREVIEYFFRIMSLKRCTLETVQLLQLQIENCPAGEPCILDCFNKNWGCRLLSVLIKKHIPPTQPHPSDTHFIKPNRWGTPLWPTNEMLGVYVWPIGLTQYDRMKGSECCSPPYQQVAPSLGAYPPQRLAGRGSGCSTCASLTAASFSKPTLKLKSESWCCWRMIR